MTNEVKYKRIEKLSELAKKDWLKKKNHLKGKFSKDHSVISWSIESLLNCHDIPYTSEALDLLWYISGINIDGKIMPRWEYSNKFYLGNNYRNKRIKEYYDIFYSPELRNDNLSNIKKTKNPCILIQDTIMWYQYFTNFPGYFYKPNNESDACKELLNFMSKEENIKYKDSSKNLTIKIGFWNNRFSIIKIEFPNDKYIICYSHYFARLNNSNDESNKYYF